MRKTIIILALLLTAMVPAMSLADVSTWKTANQVTVAWDAVTALSDGRPLPAGDTIQYEVYSGTDTTKANPTLITTVATTQTTITFPNEGRFLVGLKSIRRDSTTAKIGESALVWSDDPVVCQNGQTFGVIYFISPGNPGGMRTQ